jgi:hypothetical protein
MRRESSKMDKGKGKRSKGEGMEGRVRKRRRE